MADIISLVNLTKTFPGGVVAVDNVSLDVREGEFITLLGPSGCGKTTTLRLIAGFEDPDAGRVLLGGRDVTDDPPYKRAVNTVFQDYALFPHMTTAQNVGYGLRIAGVAKAEMSRRVEDALRMVDLLDKIDSPPAQLSGGQKQRVALARAIIRHPKVLLLDEPLSALDVKLREAMRVELKHLHEKLGITFILVTHDQKEALVMSDRIVIMDHGRIVQSGSPAELYDRPATSYVANFIGTSNLIPATVSGVDAESITTSLYSHQVRASLKGGSYVAGANVVVSIRPERVVVLAAGAPVPEGHSHLNATVIEYLFHGNSVRIELDIGHSKPFIVDMQLRGALGDMDLPEPGSAVTLAVDAVNVNVFAASHAR